MVVEAGPAAFTTTGSGVNTLFSGTCSIIFNENIYKFVGAGTPPVPIDLAPNLMNPPRDNTFSSIETMVSTKSNNVELVTNTAMYKQYTAEIQLRFTNIKLNQSGTISFNTNLCDAKPNRRTQALQITLTPEATTQDAQGNWKYDVTIGISQTWDGRATTTTRTR